MNECVVCGLKIPDELLKCTKCRNQEVSEGTHVEYIPYWARNNYEK